MLHIPTAKFSKKKKKKMEKDVAHVARKQDMSILHSPIF